MSIKKKFIPVSKQFNLQSITANSRNILVVAPHPDDDVIGMGGTMALLAREGYAVFSLYVTNGSSLLFPKAMIPPVRRQEALDALKVVKARGAILLNHISRQLKGRGRERIVSEIKEVLTLLKPGTVYIPGPFERHKTHRIVSELSVKALHRIQGYRPGLWGYAVWSGVLQVPGTKVVDISSVVSLKRRAIRRHTTQIQYKPYDTGIIARNRYEGIFKETHKPDRFDYAEIFLDMHTLVANRKLGLKKFAQGVIDILYV